MQASFSLCSNHKGSRETRQYGNLVLSKNSPAWSVLFQPQILVSSNRQNRQKVSYGTVDGWNPAPVEVGSLCLSYPIIYRGLKNIQRSGGWEGDFWSMAPEECEVVEAEELAEYQRRCGLETEHQEHRSMEIQSCPPFFFSKKWMEYLDK